MIKTLNSALLFLLLTGVAFAQSGNWKVFYASTSPLPNDTVTGLSVDKTGKVWITTYDGMASYLNGRWEIFNTENSGLPANRYNIAKMDDSLHLWVASDAGLTRYDGITWTTYTGEAWNQLNNRVTDIEFDSDGAVWFGSYGGALVKYNHYNFISYPKWQNNRVYDVAINDKGAKYIGTTVGLWDYNGVQFSQISTDKCDAVVVDDSSFVWYSDDDGLVKARIGQASQRYSISNTSLPSNSITTLVSATEYVIWIGTSNGICRHDRSQWVPYTAGNSPLPHNYVFSIACDSVGNTWIGTFRGLAVFNPDGLILSGKDGGTTIVPDRYRVSVAPNPTKATVMIEVVGKVGTAGTLIIQDILGRIVFTELVEHNSVDATPVQWDGRDLRGFQVPKGLYHIAYFSENSVAYTKLIKE